MTRKRPRHREWWRGRGQPLDMERRCWRQTRNQRSTLNIGDITPYDEAMNDQLTPREHWVLLSPRERWVLHFRRLGLTPEETGRRMRVSPFAVRASLENAERKLRDGF